MLRTACSNGGGCNGAGGGGAGVGEWLTGVYSPCIANQLLFHLLCPVPTRVARGEELMCESLDCDVVIGLHMCSALIVVFTVP